MKRLRSVALSITILGGAACSFSSGETPAGAGEELIEGELADLLEIDPADIECPAETTVLDDDAAVSCTITDPATGDRFELIATLTEFVRDDGFQERFY